jgi:hypothetical protein
MEFQPIEETKEIKEEVSAENSPGRIKSLAQKGFNSVKNLAEKSVLALGKQVVHAITPNSLIDDEVKTVTVNGHTSKVSKGQFIQENYKKEAAIEGALGLTISQYDLAEKMLLEKSEYSTRELKVFEEKIANYLRQAHPELDEVKIKEIITKFLDASRRNSLILESDLKTPTNTSLAEIRETIVQSKDMRSRQILTILEVWEHNASSSREVPEDTLIERFNNLSKLKKATYNILDTARQAWNVGSIVSRAPMALAQVPLTVVNQDVSSVLTAPLAAAGFVAKPFVAITAFAAIVGAKILGKTLHVAAEGVKYTLLGAAVLVATPFALAGVGATLVAGPTVDKIHTRLLDKEALENLYKNLNMSKIALENLLAKPAITAGSEEYVKINGKLQQVLQALTFLKTHLDEAGMSAIDVEIDVNSSYVSRSVTLGIKQNEASKIENKIAQGKVRPFRDSLSEKETIKINEALDRATWLVRATWAFTTNASIDTEKLAVVRKEAKEALRVQHRGKIASAIRNRYLSLQDKKDAFTTRVSEKVSTLFKRNDAKVETTDPSIIIPQDEIEQEGDFRFVGEEKESVITGIRREFSRIFGRRSYEVIDD